MAAFVKIIGWLSIAAGVAFGVLPFAVSNGLAIETTLPLCVFLLVTGPLLVGVAQLIEVAEKIQANTSWFSSGAAPSAEPDAQEAVQSRKAESRPQPEPEPEPEPVKQEASPREATQPQERPVPRSERRPQRPTPQLYDANRHPAAVDEWSHNGRRVMTLEDGTFATEMDGAWYRFLQLDHIDALRP